MADGYLAIAMQVAMANVENNLKFKNIITTFASYLLTTLVNQSGLMLPS